MKRLFSVGKTLKNKHIYDIVLYVIFFITIIYKFTLFYGQIEAPIAGQPFRPAWLYCIATGCLFSLPYFLFKKRLPVFILIYFLLFDFLLIANASYYRYYANVIPVFSYGEIGNLNEIKGSLFSYLRRRDALYVIITVIVSFLFFILGRYIKGLTKKQRIFIPCFLFLLSAGMVGYDLYDSICRKKQSFSLKFIYGKLYSNQLVGSYGLITLWIYQLHEYYTNTRTPLSEEEKNDIENFINSKKINTDFSINMEGVEDLNSKMETKNLILLIVESLSSWAMDYNDGEIVPFLHRLALDDETIYMRNVVPQTLHSRSADAQLLYNTGLTPPFSSSITSLHSRQYYPSLAQALQEKDNYYSFTIMGYRKQLWNQQTMNITYHFDELVSFDELQIDEIIGTGLSDRSLYRQTIDILKERINEPFYLQLISLSSHDPIFFDANKTDINLPDNLPDEIKNYIKSIEYVDATIEKFIDDLKANGLYDNSIIAMIGDHEGVTTRMIQNHLPELISETERGITFIPLFILNSEKKVDFEPNAVIGAVDIYPTLLDLMELDGYWWRGLGESIFSDTPPTTAMSMFGEVRGKERNSDSTVLHLTEIPRVSNLIISKKYFNSFKE